MPAASDPRVSRYRLRRPRAPAALLVPGVLVVLLILIPIAYLVAVVVGAGSTALELLVRGRTLAVLGATLALAATVTCASIAIALPLAWLTVRSDLPMRRFWTIATLLPLVVPSYLGGYALVAALGPRGALQALLEPIGVERLPEVYGFGGAALALTLFSYPYVVLTARAALAGLDPAYEDAARSLGRGPWRTFFGITLPQLRPAVAAGGLLVALYTLSDFGAVSLLQFDSFTRAIYLQYRASFDRTLAAELSLVLVALTAGILVIEGLLRGRARYYGLAGAARPQRRVALGVWRLPALAYCSAIVGVAVGVPTATVVFWLIRGLGSGEPLNLVMGAMANSTLAASLAAVVAVAFALPIAMAAVRFPSVLTRLLERASYSGYALPGIVIGLGLVFVAARWLPWLYQTLPLLVAAYAVRFLPQALGASRMSLLQLSPRLEDAARSLGETPRGVFRRVTLPSMRPGLMAGAALVFLTAMKELPTTVLLAPTGFDTLAVRIWSATSEGFFARAAMPSLLMLGVAGLSLLVLVNQGSDR